MFFLFTAPAVQGSRATQGRALLSMIHYFDMALSVESKSFMDMEDRYRLTLDEAFRKVARK